MKTRRAHKLKDEEEKWEWELKWWKTMKIVVAETCEFGRCVWKSIHKMLLESSILMENYWKHLTDFFCTILFLLQSGRIFQRGELLISWSCTFSAFGYFWDFVFFGLLIFRRFGLLFFGLLVLLKFLGLFGIFIFRAFSSFNFWDFLSIFIFRAFCSFFIFRAFWSLILGIFGSFVFFGLLSYYLWSILVFLLLMTFVFLF